MPIDPRIPLSGNPIAIPAAPALQQTNPLGLIQTLGQIEDVRAQVEQRRALAEATRQKAIDEADVRRAFAAANGDAEAALQALRPTNPRAAYAIEESIGKARKEAAAAAAQDFELRQHQYDLSLKLLQGRTAQNWPVLRSAIVGISKEADQLLPQDYDEPALAAIEQQGLTAQQRNAQKLDAVKLWLGDKPQESLYTALSAIDPQAPTAAQEWDGTLQNYREHGAPAAMLAQVGAFSPENHAKVTRAAIGPTKAAELAGQAEGRAQTKEYQTATLAGQADTRAQTAANQAASQAIARGQLDVARGHLAVAQAAEKRQEQAAPGGVKLSPTQQDDLATMMTVQQLGREALTIGEQHQWVGVGPVEGRIGANLPSGYGGPSGEALRNKIGNIQGTIAKLRGGTSFTPNEQKLLESYTPTITDSETKIKTKLKTLNEFIETKRQNTLRVARGEYALPGEAGPGTTVRADPMGIR